MAPMFDYRCVECNTLYVDRYPHQMEGFFCVRCGCDTFDKLPAAPAVHFKGSGFYETDYKKKER